MRACPPFVFPAENLPIGTDLVQLLLCQGAWEVGVNLRNEPNEPSEKKKKTENERQFQRESSLPICQPSFFQGDVSFWSNQTNHKQ